MLKPTIRGLDHCVEPFIVGLNTTPYEARLHKPLNPLDWAVKVATEEVIIWQTTSQSTTLAL